MTETSASLRAALWAMHDGPVPADDLARVEALRQAEAATSPRPTALGLAKSGVGIRRAAVRETVIEIRRWRRERGVDQGAPRWLAEKLRIRRQVYRLGLERWLLLLDAERCAARIEAAAEAPIRHIRNTLLGNAA